MLHVCNDLNRDKVKCPTLIQIWDACATCRTLKKIAEIFIVGYAVTACFSGSVLFWSGFGCRINVNMQLN